MADKNHTAYKKFLFAYGTGMIGVTFLNSAFLPYNKPFPIAAISNIGIFAYDLMDLAPIWYDSYSQINDIRTGKAKVRPGRELQYFGDKIRIGAVSLAVMGINIVSAIRLFLYPASTSLYLSLEAILCFNRGVKLLYSSFVHKTGEDLLLVRKGNEYVLPNPERDRKAIEIANKPYTMQDHLINGYNFFLASTGIAFTALSAVSAFTLWHVSSSVLAGMLSVYNLGVTIKICLIPTIKEFKGLWNKELEVENCKGYMGEKAIDFVAIASAALAVPLSIIAPISASPVVIIACLAATNSTTKLMLGIKNYPNSPGTIGMYTKMLGDGASNIYQRYDGGNEFHISKYLKKRNWVDDVVASQAAAVAIA